MNILILRTAPIEQMSLSLSLLRKRFDDCSISCVCQSEARELISEALLVDDFIVYSYPFFKLYRMFKLLIEVKKKKYDGIAFFYNNMPRKGYLHIEWFVLLTGIASIFLCSEDGQVTQISRGKFLKILFSKWLNVLGDCFVFLIVCFVFCLVIPYSFLKNLLMGKRK